MNTFSTSEVLSVAQEAVSQAIETHRRMGRSIVIWQSGQIVRVPPQKLTPRTLPGDEIGSGEIGSGEIGSDEVSNDPINISHE